MKTTLITLATALALGLAGCDRTPETKAQPAPAGTGSTTAPSTPQATTPTTPANVGAPSQTEKQDGRSPVQGQVDPKQPAQNKAFEQKPGG